MFDLVIVDYLMPVMKGDQLALALKGRFPNLPIVMITADAEKVELSSDKPPGVDLLIAKPFQMEELRKAVNHVLGR
jgi:CheY-like chemotaxis protein